MNRREFLKSLLASGALTAIDPEAAIDTFLTETSKLSDEDFVTYVTFTMNVYVNNPSQFMIIDGIEEPDA